ncbi:HAD family hydrolase [Dyadobacter jiangsuensis]
MSKFLCMILLVLMIADIFGCELKDKPKSPARNDDPLPSWNEGSVKRRIIAFVREVTTSGSAGFVPVADRIATFDNDGTLWSEQPVYFQLFFALDQVKAMSGKHPEWKTTQPFKAVLENNMDDLVEQGEKGLLELVAATHAGSTKEKFDSTVTAWISSAKHPGKQKLYKELVFQPMLELIKYLQVNEFKVFIVSGGGIDFIRSWAEEVYGIPREQIVGSYIKSEFHYNSGAPAIMKLPELDFYDDREGKPLAIDKFIGRKPVFAAGNSDGDLQMLYWAASNKLKNFELYIHHTDPDREWAYDRKSPVGALDKGIDEAKRLGWAIADMKNDWRIVFPFESESGSLVDLSQ